MVKHSIVLGRTWVLTFSGVIGHFDDCHNIAEVFAIFRLKETLSEFNSLQQKTYLPFSYAHKNPYHCLNFHVLMKAGNGRK